MCFSIQQQLPCPSYKYLLNKRQRKPKGQSRMENPEQYWVHKTQDEDNKNKNKNKNI